MRRLGIALVISALCAAIGVFLQDRDIPVVDTADQWLGDWRLSWAAPVAPAQRPDITIVLITEETLLDYESRSPIDRGLIAEIVRAADVAGAKAVGLDFLLDRRTSKDAAFIRTIQDANAKIVLAAIDQQVVRIPESLDIQRDLLAKAGRPYGHILVERKIGLLTGISDTTVRRIAGSYVALDDQPTPPAFVDAILVAGGKDAPAWNGVISWLRPPKSQPLFATLKIEKHRPEDAASAVRAALGSPGAKAVMRGRTVLVGAEMSDRDLHITPLSVVRAEPIPGVFVLAQALAQRNDGRYIRILPDNIWWGIGTLLALCCYLATQRFGFNPSGLAAGVLLIFAVGLISFLALRLVYIDVPSTALTVAWLLGGITGGISSWKRG